MNVFKKILLNPIKFTLFSTMSNHLRVVALVLHFYNSVITLYIDSHLEFEVLGFFL